MQYVQFGSLDTPISRFGMGCMRYPKIELSDGSEVIDEEEAIRMIRYAIDHGVNYFDTAYAYPGSEKILGKALQNGYREKVVIATKLPIGDVKNADDLKRIHDEQVARLGVDVIDIYIFHCLDRGNWEKVKKYDGIRFMEQLKISGKIRQIGFSFHSEYDLFEEIVDAYHWDMCLIQFNILDDNHQAGVRGLKYAAQKGISVAIMEPLKGGMLASKIPNDVQKLLDGYTEKRSLVEWALRFVYHFPEAKVILSGVSSMEQLKENIRIFDEAAPDVLSADDLAMLAQIKDIYRQTVRVGCTGCGYCMPCPKGINIPEIFKVYNDASLSDWTEYGSVFYSLMVSNNGKDATSCIECRSCEDHCPQSIAIADVLKEAHASFTAS